MGTLNILIIVICMFILIKKIIGQTQENDVIQSNVQDVIENEKICKLKK